MISSLIPLSCLALISPALAAGPAAPSRNIATPYTVRTLYQFPNDTYIENLAVRANGQVLVTPLSLAQLWLVDSHAAPGGGALVAAELPGVLSLTGIVEYQPDVFAVVAGNYNVAAGDPGLGTWGVWSVDLGGVDYFASENETAAARPPPAVSRIAAIPEATSLNGLSLLSSLPSSSSSLSSSDARRDVLVVGDVKSGVVWVVDTASGQYAAVLNDTFTAPAETYDFGLSATDGIRVRGDVLYFDNVGQGTLNRASIELAVGNGTLAEAVKIGPVETIATTPSSAEQWDDFAFDCEGNVFIAAGGANTVQRIDARSGAVEVVAGDLNSTLLAEPTSVKFGRREDDADVLYVTTGGGLATPVDGDIIVGGQVLAIKTGTKGSFC